MLQLSLSPRQRRTVAVIAGKVAPIANAHGKVISVERRILSSAKPEAGREDAREESKSAVVNIFNAIYEINLLKK